MEEIRKSVKKDSVEYLVAYDRENDRVCPLPQHWQELWEMLPDRTRIRADWQPSLPLILAACHDTPAISKMLRLALPVYAASDGGG